MHAWEQMPAQARKMQQKENWPYQEPSGRLVSHLVGARKSNLQPGHAEIGSCPDSLPLTAAKSSSGFRYPHMQRYAPKLMNVRESILGRKPTVNVPHVSQQRFRSIDFHDFGQGDSPTSNPFDDNPLEDYKDCPSFQRAANRTFCSIRTSAAGADKTSSFSTSVQETRLSAEASESGARYYELEPVNVVFMGPTLMKERSVSVTKYQSSFSKASTDTSQRATLLRSKLSKRMKSINQLNRIQ